MIQKIIFIIIGIILFLILNNYDTFNIGAPWIIVTDDINQNKLSGEEFSSTLMEAWWLLGGGRPIAGSLEESHFNRFINAVNEINQRRHDGNPLTNPAIYHIVKNTNPGYFRVDLEKCQNPHNKISGNPDPGSRPGLSTADREWQNKTRNNIETKPLLPRKNLNFEQWEGLEAPTAEEIEDLTESRLYNSGDSISYSCDTTKTQSKTSHELVCKPRRKFVLNAHGSIEEGMEKTSIPQLLQIKLYKPDLGTISSLLTASDRGERHCLKQTILTKMFYTDLMILNTDNTPTDILSTLQHLIDTYSLRTANSLILDKILVQKNKSYLAILDSIIFPSNDVLEELVYGEMTQLNTGKLTLLPETGVGHVDLNHLTCFNIDNENDMHCFYPDHRNMEIEDFRSNLVFLLNPFMVKPAILLDNEYTTNIDILRLTQYNNFNTDLAAYYGSTSILSNEMEGQLYSREIFPNGIHSNDLSINILERKQFESPHTPENPWDIDNISDIDKLNTICSFASSRQSNKYPPDTENVFKNDNGQTKPVDYYKCNVTYHPNLVNYLRDSVKSLLQSCSVSINPSLLSRAFEWDNPDRFNRLFPQQITRSFPLLYFNLYTIDGFVHKSGTGYELDEQNGEYTSADLRDLVTRIISQIYSGVEADNIGDDGDFSSAERAAARGYYQLFKRKMMLEKGLNESECNIELQKLYGVHPRRPLFRVKAHLKFLKNGTYLCKNLLQEVWGNYGYNYNQENSGYECYNFIADIPIIFIKLFKTQLGESADFHLLTCIEKETTDIRTIQKNGYWGCEDNMGWSEPAGNTCDFYNRGNSIEKCTNSVERYGANDNCCICKMVKNINERERQDGKPNIGPECKVRECKQTLEEKNEELRNDYPEDNMGIRPEDWTITNTWPEYMPVGRREGPGIGRNEPRKMEHIETAYRYVDGLSDVDYGKIKKIESEGCAGVLKESEPITVKCNHTPYTGPVRLGDLTKYPLYTNINAGDIKCNIQDVDPNSDIAYYSGDLNCPRNLCSAMTIDTYFDMPLGEGEGGGGSLGSGAASASSCG